MRLESRTDRIRRLEQKKSVAEERQRRCREALRELDSMPEDALFWRRSAEEEGNLSSVVASPMLSETDEARVHCKVFVDGEPRSCYVTLRVGEPPRTGKGSAGLLERAPLLPSVPVTRIITRAWTPLRRRSSSRAEPQVEVYLVAQGDHLVYYEPFESRFRPATDVATYSGIRQILLDVIQAEEAHLRRVEADLRTWRERPEGLYDDSGNRAEPFTEVRAIIGTMHSEYVEAVVRPGEPLKVIRRVGSGRLPHWCEQVLTDLLRAGDGVYEKRIRSDGEVWEPLGIVVGE